MSMKFAKLLSFAGILAMTAALIYGFTVGTFRTDGAALLPNPWGLVSLVELDPGFALFSGWIIYREKSYLRSLIWVLLMMVLGFFTASLYAFMALNASGDDWKKFWMGQRADEQA